MTTATAYGSLSALQKTTADSTNNTCNITAAGAVASLINIDNDGDGTSTNITALSLFVPGSGSSTLTIYNNDPSSALNGTILIGYRIY